MKSAVLAAAASCMIGAAGFGGALALAGSERAAWPCSERPLEKNCTTTPGITVTVPGTTVTMPGTTVVTPPVTVVTPPTTVTVTTPPTTVTVTTPGKTRVKPTCAHGDWDITAPRCKPKLIKACKGQYRREILRWCLRYEASLRPKAKSGNKPREQFTTEGGVTG